MQVKDNIVLIGFMGSGKTTVGVELAERLKKKFVDCDQFLERNLGLSISEIFEQKSEATFRKLESNCLSEILAKSDQVVATGGGVVLDDRNCELIKKNSYCVFLNTSIKTILKRIANDETRPLLKDKLQADIKQLLESRLPRYKMTCDIEIKNDNLTVDAISCLIKSKFNQKNFF